MSSTFTQRSENSLRNAPDFEEDSTDTLKFLFHSEHFRPFSDGLTELIGRCSYNSPKDDVDKKTDFIHNKLLSIGIHPMKSTIKDWFMDKHRPLLTTQSRTLLYQVCFALSAKFDDVEWFFHHVYLDRSFNCHIVDEAVYYYCFLKNLSYEHAKKLISTINNYPSLSDTSRLETIFTNEIRTVLNHCNTDIELLNFFKENKDIFTQWNNTAASFIIELLNMIQGNTTDKKAVKRLKVKKIVSEKDIEKFGLVIRELYHDYHSNFLDYITRSNITSIDFMLSNILLYREGLHKNTILPTLMKRNFPSKIVFSTILNNINTSTSYDAIRKCLILLKFYEFWCKVKLTIINQSEYDMFYLFQEEINLLLTSCGYGELFPANPYDRLFLYAAKQVDPLDCLRSIIYNIQNLESDRNL